MKKLMFLMVLGALAFTACKKDEPTSTTPPETAYANRLNGTWQVSTLTYSASLNLGGFPIPITGTAQNAGTLNFNTPTRFCTYDVRFLPNVPIPGIDTVRVQGAGTWTNTASTVSVLDTATQQTLVFTATTNTDAVQIMNTVVSYQLDSATVVPVTLTFTLVK